jgi:hypothetical protein
MGVLDQFDQEDRRDDPDAILEAYRKAKPHALFLRDFLPGDGMAARRAQIVATGKVRSATGKYEFRVATRPIEGTEEHEVISTAAVARNPGLTSDLIDGIQDFTDATERSGTQLYDLLWRIYKRDGGLSNAINKMAALIAGGGRFKVRKAKKGKKQKAQEQLQAILDEFAKRVNNAPLDGVVTGTRGLKAVTQALVRQALVEGDWIGRTVWTKHDVPNEGTFSLPMTIQSISMKYIEPVTELAGTNIEAFYWKPEEAFIRAVENPPTPELRKIIKKYVPSDMLSKLKRDKKVFLDPALLLHVKHRGATNEAMGESFIAPAMFALAYKRAVESLDLVSISNLINRMVILKVGSSAEHSPYRDPTVQLVRAQLMQDLVEDPGPNMLIVWQGDDVDVLDVGAHDAVLDLDGRHQIANEKIKDATGLPDIITKGSSEGSKSSGTAAMLAAAIMGDELQSAVAECWTTVGERIAIENGFDAFEIIFEFDNQLMLDRTEEWNQRRLDYQMGVLPIREYIAALGYDPDAVFQRKCVEQGLDPATATWQEVFVPLAGLPGQGTPGPDGKALPPGQGGTKPPGQGRTPDGVTGKPTPERAPESKSPEPNK